MGHAGHSELYNSLILVLHVAPTETTSSSIRVIWEIALKLQIIFRWTENVVQMQNTKWNQNYDKKSW